MNNIITVKDLIAFLQTQQQELPVAYQLHSEQCLLELGDICISEGCAPRPDGWVQNKRSDMEAHKYLLFPGN